MFSLTLIPPHSPLTLPISPPLTLSLAPPAVLPRREERRVHVEVRHEKIPASNRHIVHVRGACVCGEGQHGVLVEGGAPWGVVSVLRTCILHRQEG